MLAMSKEGRLEVSVKEVTRKISKDINYFSEERKVIRGLVDPILESLGWDINSKEVIPEDKTIKGEKADLVLHDLKRKKDVLIIEAKKLEPNKGNDLIKHRNQLTNYLFDKKLEYGILTNGRVWILLNNKRLSESKGERKVIWQFNLEKDSMEEILYKLNYLSKVNIRKLGTSVKNEESLRKQWSTIIEQDNLVELIKKKQTSIDRKRIENFVKKELTKVKEEDTLEESFTRMPKEIKVSGTKKPITLKNNSYKDLLVQVAETLKINKPVPQPVTKKRSSSVRYIVNKEKKHGSGKSFIDARPIRTGLYVEVGVDARTIEECVKELVRTTKKVKTI